MKTEMNHKIKRLWCASLRSGHWTQIRKQYHDAGLGRCALGVLGDVLRPGLNETTLSHWLMQNIPLEKRNDIVRMNDSGVSLSAIADWIEENL